MAGGCYRLIHWFVVSDHLPPGQANEKLSKASAATTSTTAERIGVEEDALGDSGATWQKVRDMAGEYLYDWG